MIDQRQTTHNEKPTTDNEKNITKVVGCRLSVFSKRGGQSLIEVLIGLTIGSILIGAAALGVAFMLRSTSANDNLQMASGMVQESLDKVRAYAGAEWENIYGLTKGTSTAYFLNASSTSFDIIEGKEGVFGSNITSGLVGRWNFDEATGTIAHDSTGGNYSGILTNSPTITTSTCKIGYCLGLNGSNYVDMSDPASGIFDFGANDFSLQGWFYISALPGSYKSIINKGGSGAPGYGMEIGADNTLTCSIQASGGTNQHVQGTIPSLNAWHQATCVFDRDDGIYAYLDGVAVASSTYESGNTGSISTDSYNLNVGRYAGGSWYFNGYIDDIRVYNRTLSSDEVKRAYDSAVFTRYFTIENVCRTNDASSTINGVTPCADGSLEDPATQKIRSYVEWASSGAIEDLNLIDYVTRWKNEVFRQSDWSGGSGDEDVYSEPPTSYASSTNIDIETGSFRIHNL